MLSSKRVEKGTFFVFPVAKYVIYPSSNLKGHPKHLGLPTPTVTIREIQQPVANEVTIFKLFSTLIVRVHLFMKFMNVHNFQVH